MSTYKHRPAPTGLHAKMLRELSERSPYIVLGIAATPNSVAIALRAQQDSALWSGHRDLMPAAYRGAYDPLHLLTRPASD